MSRNFVLINRFLLFQLADLPVEFVNLALDLFTRLGVFVEELGNTVEQLPFPGRDHGGVDIKSTGQLRAGLLVCQGGQGHIGTRPSVGLADNSSALVELNRSKIETLKAQPENTDIGFLLALSRAHEAMTILSLAVRVKGKK